LDGRAVIRRQKDCWGCTSCLKECKTGAIAFFLGADIGGKGSVLSVAERDGIRDWTVTAPDGTQKTIRINTKESNKY
jgi:adenylylsulfate reductase subunit B